MTGFEPWSSCVGSDRLINCTTTTGQTLAFLFSFFLMELCVGFEPLTIRFGATEVLTTRPYKMVVQLVLDGIKSKSWLLTRLWV